MEFTAWLREWLVRHPLKEPRDLDRSRYTAEVMAKVKALGEPLPSSAPRYRWLTWPQLGWMATAAAFGVVVMVGTIERSHVRLAGQISRDVQVLSSVDDAAIDALVESDPEILADDLETIDALVLAEAAPSDDQWIAQTLELLEQVGSDDATEPSGDSDDEEWLDELQTLDEIELIASS